MEWDLLTVSAPDFGIIPCPVLKIKGTNDLFAFNPLQFLWGKITLELCALSKGIKVFSVNVNLLGCAGL